MPGDAIGAGQVVQLSPVGGDHKKFCTSFEYCARNCIEVPPDIVVSGPRLTVGIGKTLIRTSSVVVKQPKISLPVTV